MSRRSGPFGRIALRGAVFLAASGVAYVTFRTQPERTLLGSVLLGYGVFFLLTTLLARWARDSARVGILLLAGDLLALGGLGSFLQESLGTQATFLSGFVVGVLVAAVGRSSTSAVLGTVAGMLVLTISASLTAELHGQPPDLRSLGLAVALIALGSGSAAAVLGGVDRAARQRVSQVERMTAVGQTLAGVAHELNNPLSAILGYSEILAERATGLPSDLTTALHHVRDQAARAARIARNLLSLVRRRAAERRPVSLRSVVEEAAGLLEYEARLAGVRIDVEVPDELPRAWADRHAVHQVVANLLQNAVQALQQHPGPRRVSVRGSGAHGKVHPLVEDTGPGVPDSLRHRVFEPFFTTKGEAGTGLGLAVSRALALDHGGDLVLESGATGGARFVLVLPVVEADDGARGSSPESAGWTLRARVLVVDDEAAVREALAAQLEWLGCTVETAESAATALRRLSRETWDVLLLDVRMPQTSGVDLYRAVATAHPDVADRVLFMTGDVANGDLLAAVEATGRPCLEKPIALHDLSCAIGAILPSHVPTRAAGAVA